MAEVVSVEGPVEVVTATSRSFPSKPAGLFSRHSRNESPRSTASSWRSSSALGWRRNF